MSSIHDLAHAGKLAQIIRPSGIYAYIDRVHLWLKKPLPRAALKRLQRECPRLHPGDQPKRWDPRYLQQLQFPQPTAKLLRMLSRMDGIVFNYAEIALDWTFDSQYECDQADRFAGLYHVKRWHGEQEIKFCNGTRYTGRRSTANKLVNYADKACRITGELHCLHLEWRFNGARALQRAGINSIGDLLRLNQHQFWQQRLLMKVFNLRAFGRHYLNALHNTHRRVPWLYVKKTANRDFSYDRDVRAGYIVLRTTKRMRAKMQAHKEAETDQKQQTPVDILGSTQGRIDACRGEFDVSRHLARLNVEHLLPKERESVRWNNIAERQGVGSVDAVWHHIS
jgi:hypothetical protein